MTMKFVPVEGGRSWEWQHNPWRYKAVALNNTATMLLYYRPADAEDSEWTFVHEREVRGYAASFVAEQMNYDTIDVPINVTRYLRIMHTWHCTTGPHAGKYGVGLAPLYVTRDELTALQAAIRNVD
ncbi:hypothetical protein [Actinophytocola sediminis]